MSALCDKRKTVIVNCENSIFNLSKNRLKRTDKNFSLQPFASCLNNYVSYYYGRRLAINELDDDLAHWRGAFDRVKTTIKNFEVYFDFNHRGVGGGRHLVVDPWDVPLK
jgi:hypothetical protein